jgi:hypothetical protein
MAYGKKEFPSRLGAAQVRKRSAEVRAPRQAALTHDLQLIAGMMKPTLLPTTFLPALTSNGRVYAFSAILRFEAIFLTISGIGVCANSADRVRAPPLPPSSCHISYDLWYEGQVTNSRLGTNFYQSIHCHASVLRWCLWRAGRRTVLSQAGLMFWFTRKKLEGSYFFLMADRRS